MVPAGDDADDASAVADAPIFFVLVFDDAAPEEDLARGAAQATEVVAAGRVAAHAADLLCRRHSVLLRIAHSVRIAYFNRRFAKEKHCRC